MSDTQIKPIKINPSLLNVTPRSVKNRTLKKTNSDNIKPNKLKQNLLTKIKNYRQNKKFSSKDLTTNINKVDRTEPDTTITKLNTTSDNSNHINEDKPKIPVIKKSSNLANNNLDDDDDFTQSINYLKNLSNKTNRKKNNTNDFPLPSTSNSLNDHNNNVPQYSSMKNGSLPTYREWKNKTLKKTTTITPMDNINNNENTFNENTFNENTFNENSEDINIGLSTENKLDLAENTHSRQYKPSKRSTTLKYHLGKRGKIVGVLVKNAATRKKVMNEHNLLKQTKLFDMKKYLKKHHLLKSGSRAPPDIIKKMYEQALLSGDVRNSNKNNIIHNYLAE